MNEPTYSELALSAYDAGYFKGEQEANENYERKLWDGFAKAALGGSIAADPNDNVPTATHVRFAADAADAMMVERKRRLERD